MRKTLNYIYMFGSLMVLGGATLKIMEYTAGSYIFIAGLVIPGIFAMVYAQKLEKQNNLLKQELAISKSTTTEPDNKKIIR